MPYFFCCCVDNRGLHSFPTRRSSDLFPKSPWGSMGAKVFDFDGDGRLDVFVTSMHPDMWVNVEPTIAVEVEQDRKSTRLNSSHVSISYAVFCLKKKKTTSLSPYLTGS